MDPSFADRYLNEGFSGGEKKRNEILQMAILEPELAILDETDSGLDIDALRVVAKGVQEVRADRPELGVLLITHYQRLLDELAPRPRAHPDRRAHRRERRHGAGRASSSARATRHGGDRHDRPRRRPDPASDFPLLDRSRSTARRIVYLDSAASVAEAPAGARRDGRASTRRPTPTCTAASTRIAAEATDALRGAPGPRSARFIGAPSRQRGGLHQERHRGAQPGGLQLGPGQPARRRRRGAHRDGAPRQHRAVADARRRAGHRAALHPAWPTTTRSTSPTSTSCSTAPRLFGVHGHVQRARHASPRCASSPTPPTPPARSPWSTAASTCPTSPTDVTGAGRRLLRLHRPQDAAARPASACCGAARSCSTPCRRSSAAAR